MNLKDQIDGIRGGYEVKYRHYRFLKRRLPTDVLERLTGGFDSLWDIDVNRYFPRVTEFPAGAKRILHPAEEDHEYWDAVRRLNIEILNVPYARARKKAHEWVVDPKKALAIANVWERLRQLAAAENKFIDRHMNSMLSLVSTCPGRWLEREDFDGFRRMCADLPRFIESLYEDTKLMRRLGHDVDVLTRKPLRVNILGVGEITTTIEVLGGRDRGLYDAESGRRFHYAVKKLPAFPSIDSAKRYGKLFDEYQRILRDDIGLKLPPWGWWAKETGAGRTVVYSYQERLPQHSNAALAVKRLNRDSCVKLFLLILAEIKKVCDFSRSSDGIQIGFDGRLPNWLIDGYDPARPVIRGDEKLLYIDTSTPMIRKGGPDLLDMSIFLKTVPALIRPIVRLTLMKEVLDRYYRPRDVVTDLIASFYLYERPDMAPALVEEANAFFKEEMSEYELKPFTEEEMQKYHRNDTMIWVFFRTVKRFDRFIQEKILRRPYEQRLPKERFVPGPFGN